MDMIDADNSIINLEGQSTLELTEKHVQAVFAVPLGEQTITNEGVDPSEACVEYTRFAAGFCEKGTHSLKAAEAYLLRDITADSRKIDIDCFKIAFVIFAVGHVLAPSAKHNYITIDFWPALNDISKIKQWSWCQYVLRHVFQAVAKFKADVARKNPTIHIVGCHFFLQVLVLDCLELGPLNRPRGLHPRIALFDYDSTKKMVDTIAAVQVQTQSGLDNVNNSSLAAKKEARREIPTMVYNFFDDLTASIVTYYAELRPRAEYITFGATNDTVPTKIRLQKCRLARDPWSIGSVPQPPAPTILRAIKDWLAASSTIRLERIWILHPIPRLLSLDGLELQQQLIGNDQLSHEMCATIFRRLGQMDKPFSKDSIGMLWRKFLEPDFAFSTFEHTTVLCNADPLTIHPIRLRFTEGTDKWNPTSCRMEIFCFPCDVPQQLPDGWVLYSFDMLKRRISVLDLAVGPFGFSNRRVNMHTFVSTQLHNALFRCLQCLFESWPVSSGEWTRGFPMIMVEKIDQNDHDICTTFFARNFDGEKLQMATTKDNLETHKNLMLYEVMRLQGNESLIPSDAIQAIKGSFVAL
ncbi:hypothetical protein ZWY2020_019402 [Hordeum vulgare]|nr:hypothetical protein ZWY2020_019402 [Hordeum vulgare]